MFRPPSHWLLLLKRLIIAGFSIPVIYVGILILFEGEFGGNDRAAIKGWPAYLLGLLFTILGVSGLGSAGPRWWAQPDRPSEDLEPKSIQGSRLRLFVAIPLAVLLTYAPLIGALIWVGPARISNITVVVSIGFGTIMAVIALNLTAR